MVVNKISFFVIPENSYRACLMVGRHPDVSPWKRGTESDLDSRSMACGNDSTVFESIDRH